MIHVFFAIHRSIVHDHRCFIVLHEMNPIASLLLPLLDLLASTEQ